MPATRRLDAALRHLAPVPAAALDAPLSTGTEQQALRLLSDSSMKRWIVDGWLPLSVTDDLPKEFHDVVHSKDANIDNMTIPLNMLPAKSAQNELSYASARTIPFAGNPRVVNMSSPTRSLSSVEF